MLRKGNISDAGTLAKIHFSELYPDFLPSLGENFLYLLYAAFLKDEHIFIYVAEKNTTIQGFIVGAEKFNDILKKILINNFFRLFIVLVPCIVKNPAIIKNIFETLLYIKKEGENIPEAELIVLSVSKEYHRKGLGRKLVSKLEKSFLLDRIKTYKVSVNATNIVANSFYFSLGFKKNHTFMLYGKKINLFIKKIK
jgi:ribosomal protein S18 acetylase RimI-like enzyme